MCLPPDVLTMLISCAAFLVAHRHWYEEISLPQGALDGGLTNPAWEGMQQR